MAVDPDQGSAAWWDVRYRSGDIPWDTGIVPPELVDLVSSGLLMPGWALDIGCGSGLSSRYLAGHGFRTVGVDLAQSALVRGWRSAAAAGVPAYFCRGDASDLSCLAVQAVFALDVGCFHALPPDRRQAYVASLAAHLVSGRILSALCLRTVAQRRGWPSGDRPARDCPLCPSSHPPLGAARCGS